MRFRRIAMPTPMARKVSLLPMRRVGSNNMRIKSGSSMALTILRPRRFEPSWPTANSRRNRSHCRKAKRTARNLRRRRPAEIGSSAAADGFRNESQTNDHLGQHTRRHSVGASRSVGPSGPWIQIPVRPARELHRQDDKLPSVHEHWFLLSGGTWIASDSCGAQINSLRRSWLDSESRPF